MMMALATAAMVVVGAPQARADHRGKITNWQEPDQGFQTARQSGKPIMIFFTAEW
jgi:hypothetical protein